MVVIYCDVLVILNLYINYFLLRGATLLLHKTPCVTRMVLSSAAGAAASLVILLPALPFYWVVLIKAAAACVMVLIAYGKQKPADFAVSLLCFFTISFVFAGLMLGLWLLAAPAGMSYSNGVAYFNLPMWAAVLFTILGYCAVRAIRYFSDRRLCCDRLCSIAISSGGKSVCLCGLADTGNGLCDIFTGKPVIVCRPESIADMIPDNVKCYLNGGTPTEGVRLLPCRTVNAQSLIPIFRADSVTVNGKPADAMIGVSRGELGEDIDCIFNPKIISL